MPDEDLADALDDLRRAYRVKLTEKLARLGSLVGEARKLRDPDKLQAARDLAHMLKGTSGSYGFDECSAALLRVEEGLERFADGAPANAAAAWLEVEQALDCARGHSS